MIGERNGAMSMAPMITAAESVIRPNVAMELDRTLSRANPAVRRDERRSSPIERKRHQGMRRGSATDGPRPWASGVPSASATSFFTPGASIRAIVRRAAAPSGPDARHATTPSARHRGRLG